MLVKVMWKYVDDPAKNDWLGVYSSPTRRMQALAFTFTISILSAQVQSFIAHTVEPLLSRGLGPEGVYNLEIAHNSTPSFSRNH